MKDREPRARTNINTAARIAVGVAIIFSGAMAFKQDQAQGKASTKWEPYNGPLTPIVLPQISDDARSGANAENYVNTQDERTQENRDNSPGTNLSITVLPVPVRNIEVFSQEITAEKNQEDSILQILNSHPELFSKKKIADFKMYYPIYKAVSDKYPNVDWFLLWINHEAETGASDSVIAFNGGTYPYFGGMQRNVNVWPKSYVDNAFKGLESLSVILTKNPTDAEEIAAAAEELNDNIVHYLSSGKERAVFNALKLYTGGGTQTEIRFGLWQQYESLLGPLG